LLEKKNSRRINAIKKVMADIVLSTFRDEKATSPEINNERRKDLLKIELIECFFFNSFLTNIAIIENTENNRAERLRKNKDIAKLLA
jgi:hypothetical protein